MGEVGRMCHLSGCDSRQGGAPALRLLHLCGASMRTITDALTIYDDGRDAQIEEKPAEEARV